ncbi:hypothetical protein BJ508DRAFT_329165 [Ascobolus immersus RN42]|uniref:Uncharacterized protein n=1 Tax=Ascobolus immersus RN42 TaxID=1160509 RepID=A0A3N4HXF9_ASCIM|nr:hypothetical protein BJ508DRAFT_329165 [Ascobolus immersus RN42]
MAENFILSQAVDEDSECADTVVETDNGSDLVGFVVSDKSASEVVTSSSEHKAHGRRVGKKKSKKQHNTRRRRKRPGRNLDGSKVSNKAKTANTSSSSDSEEVEQIPLQYRKLKKKGHTSKSEATNASLADQLFGDDEDDESFNVEDILAGREDDEDDEEGADGEEDGVDRQHSSDRVRHSNSRASTAAADGGNESDVSSNDAEKAAAAKVAEDIQKVRILEYTIEQELLARKRLRGRWNRKQKRPGEVERDSLRIAMGAKNRKHVFAIRRRIRKVLNRLNVPLNISWSYQDPVLMVRAINDVYNEMIPDYPWWSTGIVRAILVVMLSDGRRIHNQKQKNYIPDNPREEPRAPARPSKYYGEVIAMGRVKPSVVKKTGNAKRTRTGSRSGSVKVEREDTDAFIGGSEAELSSAEDAASTRPRERSKSVAPPGSKPGTRAAARIEKKEMARKAEDRKAMPPPATPVSRPPPVPKNRPTSSASQTQQTAGGLRDVSPEWVFKAPPPRIACLKITYVSGFNDFTPVAEFFVTLSKKNTIRNFLLNVEHHSGDELSLSDHLLVYTSCKEAERAAVPGGCVWKRLGDLKDIIRMYLAEGEGAGVYMCSLSYDFLARTYLNNKESDFWMKRTYARLIKTEAAEEDDALGIRQSECEVYTFVELGALQFKMTKGTSSVFLTFKPDGTVAKREKRFWSYKKLLEVEKLEDNDERPLEEVLEEGRRSIVPNFLPSGSRCSSVQIYSARSTPARDSSVRILSKEPTPGRGRNHSMDTAEPEAAVQSRADESKQAATDAVANPELSEYHQGRKIGNTRKPKSAPFVPSTPPDVPSSQALPVPETPTPARRGEASAKLKAQKPVESKAEEQSVEPEIRMTQNVDPVESDHDAFHDHDVQEDEILDNPFSSRRKFLRSLARGKVVKKRKKKKKRTKGLASERKDAPDVPKSAEGFSNNEVYSANEVLPPVPATTSGLSSQQFAEIFKVPIPTEIDIENYEIPDLVSQDTLRKLFPSQLGSVGSPVPSSQASVIPVRDTRPGPPPIPMSSRPKAWTPSPAPEVKPSQAPEVKPPPGPVVKRSAGLPGFVLGASAAVRVYAERSMLAPMDKTDAQSSTAIEPSGTKKPLMRVQDMHTPDKKMDEKLKKRMQGKPGVIKSPFFANGLVGTGSSAELEDSKSIEPTRREKRRRDRRDAPDTVIEASSSTQPPHISGQEESESDEPMIKKSRVATPHMSKKEKGHKYPSDSRRPEKHADSASDQVSLGVPDDEDDDPVIPPGRKYFTRGALPIDHDPDGVEIKMEERPAKKEKRKSDGIDPPQGENSAKKPRRRDPEPAEPRDAAGKASTLSSAIGQRGDEAVPVATSKQADDTEVQAGPRHKSSRKGKNAGRDSGAGADSNPHVQPQTQTKVVGYNAQTNVVTLQSPSVKTRAATRQNTHMREAALTIQNKPSMVPEDMTPRSKTRFVQKLLSEAYPTLNDVKEFLGGFPTDNRRNTNLQKEKIRAIKEKIATAEPGELLEFDWKAMAWEIEKVFPEPKTRRRAPSNINTTQADIASGRPAFEDTPPPEETPLRGAVQVKPRRTKGPSNASDDAEEPRDTEPAPSKTGRKKKPPVRKESTPDLGSSELSELTDIEEEPRGLERSNIPSFTPVNRVPETPVRPKAKRS